MNQQKLQNPHLIQSEISTPENKFSALVEHNFYQNHSEDDRNGNILEGENDSLHED